MPKIPNPQRILIDALAARILAAAKVGNELIALKGREHEANKDKIQALLKEYEAIGMEVSTLEGFTPPATETVPTGGADKSQSAKVALFRNGMRVIVGNLEKVYSALTQYADGLVEEEVEEAPAAEPTPPPAEPEPTPDPEPPPAAEEPAAEPPPKAEAPKTPPPPPEPPPAAEKDRKATPVTPTEGGWTLGEKIGFGCLGILLIPAVIAVVLWIGPSGEPITPPPAPQPVVEVAPPAPAPAPTPAPSTTASGALDCSLVVPMSGGDMDQDGKTEDYVLISVHGGKSSLWVEGWTSDGTNCTAGGNTVTNGDFKTLREELKKALGSIPAEGVTIPTTVQGRKVMCDIGQGPAANCFE